MSKRKGPSEENPNGGITDFLMGKYANMQIKLAGSCWTRKVCDKAQGHL